MRRFNWYNLIALFLWTTMFSCSFASDFGASKVLGSKVKSLIYPSYTLVKFLGSGGESDVFLVKDNQGKLYALKYWLKEKQHDYLRGITPFQNSIEAHKKLSHVSYVNHLYKVIDSNILILGYLAGKELTDYLQENIKVSQIISVTNQITHALTNMSLHGVIGFDTSAENIVITLNSGSPFVTFVDLGAYISVENLYQRNKDYPSDNFNIYDIEKVKKLLLETKNYVDINGHVIIDGKSYAMLPSVTFYAILADRMSLLSALLTKQYYIEKGCGSSFPKYKVKERFNKSFGDDPDHLIRPITPEIQKKALNIIENARVNLSTLESRPPYSKENFKEDWSTMEEVFSLMVQRTKECQKGLEKCIVRNIDNICKKGSVAKNSRI